MPKTDEIKKAYWYKFERKRRTFERWGTARFQQGLIDSVKGVFENLERFGPEDALRDLESELDIEPIEEAYKDVYERVGVSFARDAFIGVPQKQKDEGALEDQWVRDMRNFATTEAGERIVEVNDTTLKHIRQVLTQGVDEGLGIEEIAANMESSSGISRIRARTIARTEIVSASNRGSLKGARATGLNLKKEWIHTPDGNARQTHIDAGNADPIDHDEEFQVGSETAKYPGDPSLTAKESINCFTGDTSVSFDSCKKSIRSIYSGKVITIKTSRGFELTGTPNHPVLTDRGFIRLDKVNHSTNLICCPLDRKITHNLDVNNIPITFKEFHNASAKIFTVMRMGGVDVDLYSRVPNGNVDIVNVDSLLWDNFKAIVFKFFPEKAFKIPHFTQGLFLCFGLLNRTFNVKRLRFVSNSLIRRFNLIKSLLIRHLRPFKGFRFGLASYMNTLFFKTSTGNRPTNPHFLRNSIFAHTGSIQRNNFVDINFGSTPPYFDTPFSKTFRDGNITTPHDVSDVISGLSRFVEADNPVFIESDFLHNEPVYTLETKESIYNAGGIIARNCRCTVASIPYD